jgi:hypothetical protein
MGINCDLFDHPGDGGSHGFAQYRPTGFADGRQFAEGPFFRTVRPELIHKQSVRQHDQVPVPGLALAVAQLTISHAQLLLSVPMKGLRAGPAIFVNQENSPHFPGDAIGYQNFAGFFVSFFVPNNDNPHFVVDAGDMQAHGEVPLLLVSAMEGFAALGIDLGGQFVGADDFALPLQLAIEFQVANVSAGPAETILLGMDVVQDLGIRKIAVESEIPGDFPLADPIDQLATELSMVEEFLAGSIALLPLAEAAEFQWIVLPAAAYVIGEQIVVGDFVSPFGMVPEPPYILDELPVVIDQHIVDGNDPTVCVFRAGVALQQFQPPLVECFRVPIHLGQELVETGLVGGLGKLPIDPQDRFSLGDHQSGKIFCEMLPLRFVGEQIPELLHSTPNDLRKFDDPWHDYTFLGFYAPSKTPPN